MAAPRFLLWRGFFFAAIPLSAADLPAGIGDLQKPLKHSADNSTCDPINLVIGQHPLFLPELVNINGCLSGYFGGPSAFGLVRDRERNFIDH